MVLLMFGSSENAGESASYCLGNGPELVLKTWDRATLVQCVPISACGSRRVLVTKG